MLTIFWFLLSLDVKCCSVWAMLALNQHLENKQKKTYNKILISYLKMWEHESFTYSSFFHDLSFSESNKRSGVKRQKNSTKVCGLIFHQCFSYSSSSNCLLWIMSQKLVQMSKKNWRREPSSRLYLGFLQSLELFHGCFQSRDQQQPVIEDLVISWPFFSRTMRNIWSYYIFIFFRFAPSGSSFLCPREGHL